MGEPGLIYFNPKGLIAIINDLIPHSSESVELEPWEDKTPKRNPFLYSADERELDSRGKYSISRGDDPFPIVGSFLMQIGGVECSQYLGYLFVESGRLKEGGTGSEAYGSYETLRLRIKKPIELRRGITIPACSVKIYHESTDWGNSKNMRRDHLRRFMHWKRADLSQVLPTEWFCGDSSQALK